MMALELVKNNLVLQVLGVRELYIIQNSAPGAQVSTDLALKPTKVWEEDKIGLREGYPLIKPLILASACGTRC
jgi:hypothetical protein